MSRPNKHPGPEPDMTIVIRALQAAEAHLVHRDQMNAAVHLAPVRYSPATCLVQQGLDAADRLQEAADV